MPTGKGYLSRVVADAHRPTHTSSLPHGMNSQQHFNMQSSPAADNDSQLSTGRSTMSEYREQTSGISESYGDSDIADVRQSMPLLDSPVGRASQHDSEKKSFNNAVPGTGGNPDRVTDVAIGQEKNPASVSLQQHIENPSDKGDAEAQIFSERFTGSFGPQQEAQQYTPHIGKNVQPDANRTADTQDFDGDMDNTVALRITQNTQNSGARKATEFEAQEPPRISPMHDASGEHIQQPPPVSEAEITHPIPEARMLEAPLHEYTGGEQAATNRVEPMTPQVHIGQVDVVVVSEAKAPAKTSSLPAPSGFSSRNYLRWL